MIGTYIAAALLVVFGVWIIWTSKIHKRTTPPPLPPQSNSVPKVHAPLSTLGAKADLEKHEVYGL